jgi:hypothetical protein
MRQQITERFVDSSDRDELLDDPERIAGYRPVGLAEGLMKGSEEDVLWAWQWWATTLNSPTGCKSCFRVGSRN